MRTRFRHRMKQRPPRTPTELRSVNTDDRAALRKFFSTTSRGLAIKYLSRKATAGAKFNARYTGKICWNTLENAAAVCNVQNEFVEPCITLHGSIWTGSFNADIISMLSLLTPFSSDRATRSLTVEVPRTTIRFKSSTWSDNGAVLTINV